MTCVQSPASPGLRKQASEGSPQSRGVLQAGGHGGTVAPRIEDGGVEAHRVGCSKIGRPGACNCDLGDVLPAGLAAWVKVRK